MMTLISKSTITARNKAAALI